MNRFCSMFSQILQLFPRSEFELLVRETKTERHARGFSCWDQFVSMIFCQSCDSFWPHECDYCPSTISERSGCKQLLPSQRANATVAAPTPLDFKL
jgi:hypothetical protein